MSEKVTEGLQPWVWEERPAAPLKPHPLSPEQKVELHRVAVERLCELEERLALVRTLPTDDEVKKALLGSHKRLIRSFRKMVRELEDELEKT